MHCSKVLIQELLCFDNDFENNLENSTWNLEHNGGKVLEILNRMMQRIISIIITYLSPSLRLGHQPSLPCRTLKEEENYTHIICATT